MAGKFCTNCNIFLNSEVKFCPECGGAVQKASIQAVISKMFLNNKRKIIIIASIVIALIILGIVIFSIVENVVLTNNANISYSRISCNAEKTNFVDSIGNHGCNITAQAYSVANDKSLFFVGEDGIYKYDWDSKKEVNVQNSRKLAGGKFSSLNYFDEKLWTINSNDNSIYRISDINNEKNNPYVDNVYTPKENVTLTNIAINSNNIYTLSKDSSKYYLTNTNIRNQGIYNEIWQESGKNCWMYLDEFTLRICISNGSSWVAYKGDIDGNKNSGITKYCSGNGTPTSVAFYNDKIYALNSNVSSNTSSISVYDASGNRSDFNLDSSTSKLLLSGDAVFAQCSNNHFLWFNTDTNMTHDISGNFKDESVKTININNGKFCVLYSDDSVVLSDISSLS